MYYVTASDLEVQAKNFVIQLEEEAAQLPATVKLALLYEQTSGTVPVYDANSNVTGSRPAIEIATGGGSQPPWGGSGQAIVQGSTDPNTIATKFDLSIGDPDNGDPTTLENFITWAAQMAPASHYALVLVDHGADIRGSNWSVENNTLLSIPELHQALSTEEGLGINIGLVAYSGCNMGAFEVAYGIGDTTSYVVASEDQMNTGNWNYPVLALGALQADPSQVTPKEFALDMVNSEQAIDPAQTLSVIDTSRIDDLASALLGFTEAVTATSMTIADWQVLQAARDAAEGYANDANQRDLGQFMAQVATHIQVSSIRSAAQDVLEDLQPTVPAMTTTPADDSGLTIYFPGPLLPGENVAEREFELGSAYADHAAFAASTGWSSFLGSFVAQSIIAPASQPLTVLELQRFGFHDQPTTLVLSFSAGLDPARAQDPGNYLLVRLLAAGRTGPAIRLGAAVYDPAANTVTLRPLELLPLHDEYLLTVNGNALDGVVSAAGESLDGSGQPGSNYVRKFSRGALAGANSADAHDAGVPDREHRTASSAE